MGLAEYQPRTFLTPRIYARMCLRVTARCGKCQRVLPLDLAQLATGPQADTPLIELPLQCKCGASGHNLIIDH